ncbi:hypothetical protein JCM19236_5309 [Vibrio sp. JCM 19236]|nr:hypothetical protein JCM19236_5309 [Vibrio sp. JCM 19236]
MCSIVGIGAKTISGIDKGTTGLGATKFPLTTTTCSVDVKVIDLIGVIGGD